MPSSSLEPSASLPDVSLLGWRVRSEIPLTDLAPWSPLRASWSPSYSGEDSADVTITLGSVPEELAGGRLLSPALQVGGDSVLLTIPRVARYLITGGSQVRIQPVVSMDAPDIRVFLYGTVAAVLCYQRGVLPLHAAAVLHEGRAIVLCGVSGAGKSTLAAALARRGLPVLADDLCGVTFSPEGVPLLQSGYARLRLWSDVTKYLGIATEGLERSRPELAKFHLPVSSVDATRIPIGTVFLLGPHALERSARSFPIKGLDKVRVQADLLYRTGIGRALGKERSVFADFTRLAKLPFVQLQRSHELAAVDALAEAAMEAMTG